MNIGIFIPALTHLTLFGRHFADDIFKYIFMNENFVTISLQFVPEGPIDNNSALVQIMAFHLFSTKPLSEPMLTQFTDIYMWH